jgi:hypothetical protein
VKISIPVMRVIARVVDIILWPITRTLGMQ